MALGVLAQCGGKTSLELRVVGRTRQAGQPASGLLSVRARAFRTSGAREMRQAGYESSQRIGTGLFTSSTARSSVRDWAVVRSISGIEPDFVSATAGSHVG